MPPRHPFTSAALFAKARPAHRQVLPSNRPDDIKARQDDKKKVDFDEQPLKVCNQTKGRPFTADFALLVERYPDNSEIIKQLLLGATVHVGGRLVSYQVHQDAYYSIREFVEFLNSDEPKNKIIKRLDDFDGQVCLNFRAYLLRVYPGRTVNRKRYGALRSVVAKLQKKYKGEPWVGSLFNWPRGPDNNEQPSEGYSSEVHNALIDGCLKDIKAIMEWMDQDEQLLNVEEITGRELSINNVMYELVRAEDERADRNDINPNHKRWFEWIIRGLQNPKAYIEQTGISIDEFLDIYRKLGRELAATGRPINGTKISTYGLIAGATLEHSARVAIVTTRKWYADWPMHMEFEEANDLLSVGWSKKYTNEFGAKHTTREMKLWTLVVGMRFSIDAHSLEVGQMAYFSSLMFTMNTLFPFILLLLIQTGWNFETLMSIGMNLEDHVEDDLLDTDYVILYGYKARSEKSQMHRSNKRDKFGAYQLLIFIRSIMVRFENSTHLESGRLFQCILSKNLWKKFNRLCTEMNSVTFSLTSVGFLERHGISLCEEKAKQKIEVRKLRTTYETRRREQGLDIEEVVTGLGHADVDTTIKHYDSESGSSELLNNRLRGLQEKHVIDFRHYSANILSDLSMIELRKATEGLGVNVKNEKLHKVSERLGVKVEKVVSLLSPAGQTYIASCLDAESPNWPGAERFVPTGIKCNYFNRCPLCTQCVIFEESLPFIARRIRDLESMRSSLNSLEWAKNYGDEYQAFSEILDAWESQDAVAKAYSVCMQTQYSLPLTMRGANQ